MTNQINVKGTYIPNLEAEDIFNMSYRGLEDIMKYRYTGMITYSLELIKLRSYKHLFAERSIEKNSKVKYYSDAVINVKFKTSLSDGSQVDSSVKGLDTLMNHLTSQVEYLNRSIEKLQGEIDASVNERTKKKLQLTLNYFTDKLKLTSAHIERIGSDGANEIYAPLPAKDLRMKLYTEGFTFKGKQYVFYKRTASKSRQSQCLFILADLHDRMKEWSHMGLDLSGNVDVASVLAYESLVSSSIETTIDINPENIFIIDDKFSTFKMPATEVHNNLKATFNPSATIENNIWDGQGLIDVSLMASIDRQDKGMILTRQHFWKSCLFNTNLQQYLKDNCPEGTDFNEWKLVDMFGNKVLAKDILVVTTPSSIKWMKFADKVENKAEQRKIYKKAFANWKKRVKKDKNLFGVCKSDKPSKYGERSFTSYQMVNTLQADKRDIEALAQFEVDYIRSLQGQKNEDGTFNENSFIEYLEEKKDLTNAFEMLAEMYKVNPAVTHLEMFRKYRTKQISSYRTKVKGGKLRLEADYCTVTSNPMEMLQAVIEGKRKDNNIVQPSALEGNEIYTTLHEFGKEYTLVRNPHNSMNNFFKSVNKRSECIERYFNFTKNIVVVNAIGNPVFDRLNGMDVDSDTTLIFKSSSFNAVVDKTLQTPEYNRIILNKVKSSGAPVPFTNENICFIDLKTAKSQTWIGETTNAVQHQVSLLWDVQQKPMDHSKRAAIVKEIMDNVAIGVVLSNLAIDYSKKVVEVDIAKALREIRSSDVLKMRDSRGNELRNEENGRIMYRPKPKFWKYVSSSNIKTERYNCPMDILAEHIDSLDNANYRSNISLNDLLIDEIDGYDAKQIKDIMELVQEFNSDMRKANHYHGAGDEVAANEKGIALEEAYDRLDDKLKKKTIRKPTMLKILHQIADMYDAKTEARGKKQEKADTELSSIAIHLMNAMYRTNKGMFLKLFKK